MMAFTAEHLLKRLDELAGDRVVRRYLVAFSGGLDSTVLLHALAACRAARPVPIVAVHVNHALQSDAGRWERHCRKVAARLDVRCIVRRIDVPTADGRGTEAAAREVRYAAISELLDRDDLVISAHHEDDQAETLLLNLLRGSGTRGMAGIGAVQPLGAGRLVRPLLDVPRRALLEYATRNALSWVDDASNADVAFDRNFLRREILPRLAERWPAAAASLGRSAQFASEAEAMQVELADIDLATLTTTGGAPGSLDLGALRRLSCARQRNVLRRAIGLCGLPVPPAKRLFEVLATLIPARRDAQPVVRWPGAEMRRYRERLFILPEGILTPPAGARWLAADGAAVDLGPGLGSLQLAESGAGGIRRDTIGRGLELRFRGGGERFRPHGRKETHRLKNLLQEAGIVPWMRSRIPLLYSGDTLIAVGDMWIDAAAWSAPGLAVRWRNRPALT